MNEVIRLERDRFGEVVDILCSAFRDYPVMRYVLSDTGEAYEATLPALIGFFTESRFARAYPVLGIVMEGGGGLVAAANVNPPCLVPAPAELERSYAALCETLGADAMARFGAFADACAPLEPEAPHYYLGMVGVRPEARGRGHARRLLDAVHDMSARDPDSTGVCLTTELQENIGLYERFGYRTLGRAVTADGGLESWTMFRGDAD